MNDLPLSSSLEDYLEAIAEIIETNGHAHAKDIAERLKVKMPSVTNALQSLCARDLIRYQSHSPVVLTAAGAERSTVIRRRHANLKNFLQQVLFLEQDEADAVACRMEHNIGEKVSSRFVALGDAIAHRPEGAALREYLAERMPGICDEPTDNLCQLSDLKANQQSVVVRVAPNLRGIKKFADLGLVPGTLLTMAGHAPFGDLLRIKVMGSNLSIRKQDADFIWVKRIKA